MADDTAASEAIPAAIYAAGVLSAQGSTQTGSMALLIEQAMIKAIEDANAEGISDPVLIKERVLASRAAILEANANG